MSLIESIESDADCFMVELTPPKGVELREHLDLTYKLRGGVEAYLVSDTPKGEVRMCPGVLARRLLEIGQESLLGMSCQGKNQCAMQAMLLGACADGIRWIVVARQGDIVDKAESWSDDSIMATARAHELLEAVRALSEGKDLAGHPISGPLTISGAAEIDPFVEGEAFKQELGETEIRAALGARFFITPPVDDVVEFEEKIHPFSGRGVPIVARLGTGGRAIEETVEMARELRRRCKGVCFVPDELDDTLPVIMAQL